MAEKEGGGSFRKFIGGIQDKLVCILIYVYIPILCMWLYYNTKTFHTPFLIDWNCLPCLVPIPTPWNLKLFQFIKKGTWVRSDSIIKFHKFFLFYRTWNRLRILYLSNRWLYVFKEAVTNWRAPCNNVLSLKLMFRENSS